MEKIKKNPLDKTEEETKKNKRLLEAMIIIAVIGIIAIIFWPVRKTIFNIKSPVAEKNVSAEK